MRNPSDFTDGLAVIGIGSHAGAVYRMVLGEGMVSVELVAEAFSVGEPVAHAMLERLRAAGLVNRGASDGRYAAVDPRVSLRAVADRTEDQTAQLRSSIPALASVFERRIVPDAEHVGVRLLVGADEVGAAYNRLEHEASAEFMAFDRPPYVLAPVNPIEPVVISRGVRWRAVYAASSLEQPGAWDEIQRSVALGEQARLTADLPVKLAIADRRVAIVSTSLDPSRPEALATESASLLDLLCEVFEAYWERAVALPERADAPRSANPQGPSGDDLALLALFAAGAKDEVIARELGMSSRTVRRRSQSLLRRLGAGNRFQAGAQAVRRGWI